MQIRTKISLQFILIVSALLLISLCTIYYFSEEHRKSEFYNQLHKKANTTAELLFKVREVDSVLLKLIDRNRKDIFFDENISIYNQENEEIYTNNDSLDFKKLLQDWPEVLQSVRNKKDLVWVAGEMEIIGTSYVNGSRQYIVLAGAIDRQGLSNIRSLKNILTGIFFIMLVFVGFMGWFFAGRALSPISKVVDEVDKITENNLDSRLDVGNRSDEIGRLLITFNKMLERIKDAFKIQKTFIANASHELRTPLTKITSQLEVALLNERDKEAYKNIIASVLEDIRNLNEVSHLLLELTKLKNEETELSFELIRIDDLIWEAKAEFLQLHSDCKVNFYVNHLPEDENRLMIKGNAVFLKTCFNNLLENACKFSPDHTVSVSLDIQPRLFEIVFRNKGASIDPNDLPYIFEPFYRSKNSEGRSGYGIGLSLVKRIVTLHNGSVQVSTLPGQETCFTILMPVAKI